MTHFPQLQVATFPKCTLVSNKGMDLPKYPAIWDAPNIKQGEAEPCTKPTWSEREREHWKEKL